MFVPQSPVPILDRTFCYMLTQVSIFKGLISFTHVYGCGVPLPPFHPLNFLSLLRSDRARRITLTRKREFNEKHTELKMICHHCQRHLWIQREDGLRDRAPPEILKFYFLDLFAGRKVVDKAFFFLRLKYSFENCSYIINDWIYPTWPQITLQTLGQLHFEKINK